MVYWLYCMHLSACPGFDSIPVIFLQHCGYNIVTIRTYTTDFIYFTCTDTGVIVTHAFIFLPASSPIVLVQLAVVTQSCALLYITAHCDLLLQ